ncbi:hypothetical protein [Pseudoroseicyclus aestuarii]|uniref:Uncharacterized protein n=1 Tax=Pseudoroseicyclus aestuarii TaxID=1795041 RepID=A0A318SXH7_9RHOB|nr:hypothetical protein [Pseudoroseicyclus aestuarii]PYE86123.1 hypothetical protein DFP88_101799 [Pseudoroseicyclus aestuarii]
MKAAALILTSLAASPALAEGARLTLTCSTATVCTGPSACRPGGGPIEIVLAPQDTDAAGAGTYTARTAAGEAEAQAAGHLGPFAWQEDAARVSLVLASEAQAVLVRSDGGAAQTSLLTCDVTQ